MAVQSAAIAAHTRELGRLTFLDARGDGLSQPRPLDILIIDDSDDDFMIARRTLRLMDTFKATVHHAHDLSEARIIVDREPLDVILVDFCLGLETGAGAIADLGGRIASAVPILLTGMPGQDVSHIALRAGAVHCLDKNHLTPVLLETAIRSALHTHALEKKLQEAIADLELANRAKSDFFARIGRDLQAPLHAILNSADLIATESFGSIGGEKYSNSAECIRHDSKHLLHLLDTLVEDALKDGTSRYAARETIDLRNIVCDAIRAVERERPAHGGRLELSLPDQPSNILGQPFILTQALYQLFSDTLDRSLPHDKIFVTVSKEANYWGLRVSDKGTKPAPPDFIAGRGKDGLSPDHRDRLGLLIVSDIVKNHYGILQSESIPNAGTTISIFLPIAVSELVDS
jgi:signal transduction histidine kinase